MNSRALPVFDIAAVHGHFCQIHQQEAALVQAVVKFLAAGVANGESVVLVTRRQRQQLILDWLKAKLPAAARLEEEERLMVHPSTELLEQVMRGDSPQWEMFEPIANGVLRQATGEGKRAVRIYGDAVSELWQSGRHAAAVELETLWNRVLPRYPAADAFCGYLIDALSPQSYSAHLEQLSREHCMMAPGYDQLNLLSALEQASREVLGRGVTAQVTTETAEDDWRQRIPLPMRCTLWLLENEEQHALTVLERARELYETERVPR